MRRDVTALVGLLALVVWMGPASISAQRPPSPGESLAARLGLAPDSRLVMIHADDGGVTHSINQAIERAFGDGSITSASIIVPAPWFPELAAFAKAHPEYDFGLHLALTSEWTMNTDAARAVRAGLRWGGVASRERIPSLLDADGFLWSSSQAVATNVKPEEARIEMRAQIERARQFGVPFTHFDTHMDALTRTPELTAVYRDLSREYRIPIWSEGTTAVSLSSSFVFPGEPVGRLDRAVEQYRQFIGDTRPDRVTVVIIHPALDTEELRAAIGVENRFGTIWRAVDFDVFTSPAMHAFLKQQPISLVNWKQVRKLFGPE